METSRLAVAFGVEIEAKAFLLLVVTLPDIRSESTKSRRQEEILLFLAPITVNTFEVAAVVISIITSIIAVEFAMCPRFGGSRTWTATSERTE